MTAAKILSLITLMALVPGCVEIDGPPILHEISSNTTCALTTKRKAIPKDLVEAFPPCCNGEAVLIPDYLIPKEFHKNLEQGPEETLCVPKDFAVDAEYTPPACTSVFGLKGACLSPCLPEVKNQDLELPKDGCPGDMICAPCVHPQTEKETGACKFGLMACDAPPKPDDCKPFEPSLDLSQFSTCCSQGEAHCAPASYVDQDQRKDLSLCSDGESYCVPDDILVRGGKHQPPTCRSLGGLEGRCLSVCVKSVAEQIDTLPRASCKPDERCAPCYDPRTGESTGACEVGPCDKPQEKHDACKPLEPTFDLSRYKTCCDKGRAHCAPAELVDPGQRKDLSTCSDGKSFCVPDDILSRVGKHQPLTCNSVGGREGRCLSVCVKSVAEQMDTLPRSICKSDERCVPCYDPRTGLGTGACTVGPCDKPKEPAKTFQLCGKGGDDALCVPANLVPKEDRCYFDTQGCGSGCTEPGTICVPRKIVDSGPTFEPKPCKVSMAGFLAGFLTFFTNPFEAFKKADEYSKGACISECLPNVKSNPSAKMLSQGSCDPHEKCVPCYDPLKLNQGKVSTGACQRDPCP